MDKSGLTVTLCADPADDLAAADAGLEVCHLAYCIGENGRLWRGPLGIGVRGGLLGLSDRVFTGDVPCSPELIHELKRECDLRGYRGVLCDFERPPCRSLSRFCAEAAARFSSLGMDLYLPEAYTAAAPSAYPLVSSRVIDGSFHRAMSDALERTGGRGALVFEPVCIEFALPSPDPKSDCRIPPSELESIRRRVGAVPYFSRELCANYFTYRTADGQSRFALFDDPRSMVKKLDAARRVGFSRAFVCYPDARDSLGTIRDFLT